MKNKKREYRGERYKNLYEDKKQRLVLCMYIYASDIVALFL